MRIDDKINQWQKKHRNRPFFSLEFFPPKTNVGVLNLYDRFDRFADLNPLWIDVTWGAGGSTAHMTLEIVAHALKYNGLEPCMHLTCTNMSEDLLEETLLTCYSKGIRNIMALRGDPPQESLEWKPETARFKHAVDLVKYIKSHYGDYFCIGVAGYPEGHLENPDIEDDLRRLKEKVDAGANFIITQLFFDVSFFQSFLRRCRAIGITVPILPGILPVQSYAGFKRCTTMCHTKIPSSVLDHLETVKDDDQKVKDFGVELGVRMCKDILVMGAIGLHFYTLNLEVSVLRILDCLNILDFHLPNRDLPWRGRRVRGPNKQSKPTIREKFRRLNFPTELFKKPVGASTNGEGTETPSASSEAKGEVPLAGSVEESGLSCPSADTGTISPAVPADETDMGGNIVPSTPMSWSCEMIVEDVRPIFWSNRPKSYIQRTANWDDFPNGRWGPRESPAYGEPFYSMCSNPDDKSVKSRQDMWGSSIESVDDVVKVFVSYLKNQTSSMRLPWTTESLGEETQLIKNQLVKLNTLGLCTINSQPRVNGALSTDSIFGWGPRDGVVYQKAYVEFFCSPELWCKKLLPYLKQSDDDYYYYIDDNNDEDDVGGGGGGRNTSAAASGLAVNKSKCKAEIDSNGEKKIDDNPLECTTEMREKQKKKIRNKPLLSFMAVKKTGKIQTNVHQFGGKSNVNAVTWGAFPNAEIRQPTVVDLDSFNAWRDEAFKLWEVEWASIYPDESKSKNILLEISDSWYLVNIVDNNILSGDLFVDLIDILSE